MSHFRYPAHPEKPKATSNTVLAVAQRALENRLEHLKTVRGIWQKNIDQTDAELAVVEAQLERLTRPLKESPDQQGKPVPKEQASTKAPSNEDLTFKFNY